MKLILLLVPLIFAESVLALKMSISSQQARTISRLYTELNQGQHEKTLNESLKELKLTGGKSRGSFSDLPYRIALAEIALLSAKTYQPVAVAAYANLVKSAIYQREDDLVQEHSATIEAAVTAEKIHYTNVLALINLEAKVKDELAKKIMAKKLDPLAKAVAAKTVFSKEDIQAVREYADFSSKYLNQYLRNHPSEVRDALGKIFQEAHVAKQTENALTLRELQVRAAPPGIERAKAKFLVWHLHRSRGDIDKSLAILDCDNPKKMAENLINQEATLSIQANCYNNLARTLSSSYESAQLRRLYKKLHTLEARMAKADSETQYYYQLSKFEIEKSLLETAKAKATFERLEQIPFGRSKVFLMSTCDKKLELYSIVNEKNPEIDACVAELEKAMIMDAENISHYSVPQRNLAQYYLNIGDVDKFHFWVNSALEDANKNLPDHGFLKHTVYISAAHSVFISKNANKSSALIAMARKSVADTKLGPKLETFFRLHEELFFRKKTKQQFLAEFNQAYGTVPQLKKIVDSMAAQI